MRKLLIAFLFPLAAQASETITVQYIEVPVSVVGRDGNPVRGLTRENFRLFDNRRPVAVTAFDTIDFGSPASLKANAKNPAAHRAFLLLFDLINSQPSSLGRAQAAARTFVQKTVLPGDLVGVGTLDLQRGYRLLVNFTSDRTAVAQAIDHPGALRSSDPLQLSAIPGLDKQEIDRDQGLTESAKTAAYYQWIRSDAERLRMEEDQRARQKVHQQIDWLAQLAASLRNLRGRPQIVFLSDGFDSHIMVGRSAKEKNEEYEDAESIISGTWWNPGRTNFPTVDLDRHFGSTASLTSLQAMTQAFRGSGVILHAIDIQGLRIQSDVEHGAPDNNDEALALLARPTGGEVFRNSNDLAGNFARMLHQQEVVYVLGFQAPVTDPGKLHDLRVELAGGPRGATVYSRQGYFEGGTRTTQFEDAVNAADVVLRDIPQSGVRVAALAAAFPTTKELADVPVVIDIDGSDLLKGAKDNNVTAELFVYAFDDEGAVRYRVYERLALDLAKVGDKLRKTGVKYIATLGLPPGKFAVKTLVQLPATGERGFARSDVVVPKSGETVLLPPFVLDDPQAWVLVRGAEHDRGAYPFQVNGEPFVPSAAAHPPPGAVRKVAVFVCNAHPQDLIWETTPPATLLAQVEGAAATKLVWQLDDKSVARFGVTVRKNGAAVLTASTPLH
ncbi:MAG TPA: VWA domain-containing protein [Thermoanaerobaculia bacterium]|nr:VWA domain-containing protein [Thermoanaerobaculia bacterium]